MFGGITLPNPASVRLHESLGFRQVAVFPHVGYKLGAWHDVGFWQKSLAALGHAPPPPAPFASLDPDEIREDLSRVPKVGLEPTTPRL